MTSKIKLQFVAE